MSVIISGNTPNTIAAGTVRSTASAPKTEQGQGAKLVPAATVEISSAARQAQSGGNVGVSALGPRPLNIIWGDSPR